MFSKHVARKLSAYCQGELSEVEVQQIAYHLNGCENCRAELETIKLGIRLAQSLPLKPAPPALAFQLAVAANAPKPRSRRLWRWGIVVAASVLFIGWGWSFWTSSPFSQPKIGWEVAQVAGEPKVEGAILKRKGWLGVGEWLETDNDSRAHLKVAEIGYVNLDANSRLQLVTSEESEHRLNLVKGKLSAFILAPPRLFLVDTPSATAVDLGCAYTLEVDEAGNTLLHVTSGWVSLMRQGREMAIPAGMICATRQGKGIGTPFMADASPVFKQALEQLDFSSDASGQSLPLLLSEARELDSLTLWHLLTQLEKFSLPTRDQIFDRLSALAPPPLGVTRGGILAGDQPMLDLWRIQKIH